MARLALAAALAAALVAVVAVLDHRHKRSVEFAAQEDAYFCANGRPASCNDFDAVAYEQRWERREFGYRVTFFCFGAAAIGLGLGTIVVRRRRELPA